LWQLISIQRHIRGKVHGRDESLARSNEAKSCLAATEENFLFVLQRGFFALLLIGFVLHVFEDSMVNYLFFIIYGIALGSLSRLGASR
jgi:hypothetical protein